MLNFTRRGQLRHLIHSCLVASFAFPMLVQAQQPAADPEVEEVVVTGSYIRRSEGFQAASPVTQLTADDITAAGTPNLGDVIQNMSINQGTTISANAFTGASNIATSVNLRGLGSGATLTLLDGMRIVESNVNVVLPQIAIQRLDIVTDGAAALYGSAAVAGVVNFVPIKSYDGFKFETMSTEDDEGDYNDIQFSSMFGTEFNGIDIVMAANWREHSRLEMRDRPETLRSAFVWSSTATPGDYTVPLRDANGNLRTGAGSTIRKADPACGLAHEDPTQITNGKYGFLRAANNCAYDYGEFWDYRYPTQQGTLYTSASYDFSDDFSLSAQFNYWNVRHEVRGSPINPGGRVGELPLVRGEIPGNPYRAVNASGVPLFAQDANRDGVPDRVGGMFGTVILDPNGIPFNEDVRFLEWRPWAKHGTLPSIFNSDGSSPRDGLSFGSRAVVQADFKVPYIEGWEGHAAYMWGNAVDNDKEYEGSFGGLNRALLCDVATDRKSCFTPFVTLNPANLNTQAVADSTVNYSRERNEDILQTFDLVLNGDVPLGGFELPGGTIGAAVGYQRRDEQFDDIPTKYLQQNDQWIGAQQLPRHGGSTVDSFFAELALPVLDNLEVQLAARDESYSTGQSSTDPKYGIAYSPFDSLTLRATKGTSFIAPSLDALTAPQSCGLNNIADKFTTYAAFTSSCNQGNPDLVPESADTLSAGFDWDIMDGMRFSLTYSETDFSDRIIASNGQDIIDLDFFNFRQETGFAGNGVTQKPTSAQVAAWVNDPRSDKRVVRNPFSVDIVTRVYNGSSNASSMLVKAWDVNYVYSFELPDALGMDMTELGSFNINLAATYMDEYSYQLRPDRPSVQAVGERNWSTGAVPPVPRIKGDLRLGWLRGNHSASLTSHYIHSLDYEGYQGNVFLTGLHSSVVPRTVTDIRASHIEDFAYNYSGYEALGGDFIFSLGSRNVFDRRPQRMAELGGTEDFLYDSMGRVIYARVSFEM